MKKVALLAVLLASVAVSANAQFHAPSPYPQSYTCTYTNPTMQEKSPGVSFFRISPYYNHTLWRGIEEFEATHQFRWDNRKVTFYDPVDVYGIIDPERVIFTRWKLSVDPSGPVCNVIVRDFGKTLTFTGCTDGHSRSCTRN